MCYRFKQHSNVQTINKTRPVKSRLHTAAKVTHKHSSSKFTFQKKKKSRTITVLSHKGSVSAELFPSPNTSLIYCWRHAEDDTFFVRQKVSNALVFWRFIGVPGARDSMARAGVSRAQQTHSNEITLDSRKRVGSIELLFSVIRFTWFNVQNHS